MGHAGELGVPAAQPVRADLSRVQLTGAAVAVGAAALYVGLVDPSGDGWFPSCPTRVLSGVWCPACGLTRATHHLLLGDVVTAVRFNLFVVPVLLALALVFWREGRRSFGRAGRAGRRWAPPVPVVAVSIVVLVAYAALRNLPALDVLRGA